MKTITRTCQECNKEFEALLKEVNRGNAKVCSRECARKSAKKALIAKSSLINIPNVHCSYCGIAFYKNKSKKSISRSGLYFCCREHKDLAQRIEFGLNQIQPNHYSDSLKDYRKIVISNNDIACSSCGYNKHPEILEVHHNDRNRLNNSVENLTILCPTCHMEDHFLNKDGRWKAKALN